jgi:hypothetical protein
LNYPITSHNSNICTYIVASQPIPLRCFDPFLVGEESDVGAVVGDPVDTEVVGTLVGAVVVGVTVGDLVGAWVVGEAVVGALVGAAVGIFVGAAVGVFVGAGVVGEEVVSAEVGAAVVGEEVILQVEVKS